MRLPPAHPVPGLGEFLWPRPRSLSRALLCQPDLSLSFNARGALFEAASELKAPGSARDEVLVPGFHCPSGITPFLEAGLRCVYYRVRPDLSVDWADLLAKVGPRTAAVVVVHFFGFETDMAALQPLRAHGIRLIEDWSHSFLRCAPLSLPRAQGDYQVFSFWKLAPTGVGGGLRRLGTDLGTPWPRGNPPAREALVRGKQELEELLAHSPHRRTHAAFQALERWRLRGRAAPAVAENADTTESTPPLRGEDRYPFDRSLARAAMPPRVLKRLLATDLGSLADTRRRHHAALAAGLVARDGFVPLHPQLDGHTCPWVFPVRLRDRDRIDRGWRAQGVALHTFGIWLHSGLAQADLPTRHDAHQLAEELLCLSVHQGLADRDIARTIAVIQRHFETA